MKIIAISGSTRSGSTNTMLLENVIRRAPEGMEIELVSLKGIPLYDGDDEQAHGLPPAVVELQQRIRDADGVMISTPEYNFSIPGVLKNATDWLSRGKNQPFQDKRVGIMGASGGPVGTARSQYHLRQNLQGLMAQTMPKPEIFVGNAGSKFNEERQLTDETTLKFLDSWLAAFEAWVARDL